jgi:hypothetical protein
MTHERRITVNAPTSDSAGAAVRAEMAKRGPAGSVTAVSSLAGADKPDDAVAIVVTKPVGPRHTYLVWVTLE